jgi:anti-sigma factor RsiW
MTDAACIELHESMFEFVEGELEVAVRVRYEQHLLSCPPCKVSIESYKATVTIARALPKCAKPLNPEFEARLRKLLG